MCDCAEQRGISKSLKEASMSGQRAWPTVAKYAAVMLFVSIAWAGTELLPPLHETPAVLFFGAIVLAARIGGRGPAIAASLASILAIDFFFVSPRFSLLSSLADVLRLVVFLSVALLLCYLQEEFWRAAVRLYGVNEELE